MRGESGTGCECVQRLEDVCVGDLTSCCLRNITWPVGLRGGSNLPSPRARREVRCISLAREPSALSRASALKIVPESAKGGKADVT